MNKMIHKKNQHNQKAKINWIKNIENTKIQNSIVQVDANNDKQH